ncbi:hypothetical protein [Methylocella sp.]|uniref:hypothetical protein n=1 Tax=Methylocella sp. TaxID=1978226 RepID=UPI0035B36EA7
MSFARNTYRVKENDARRCSTCQFSGVMQRDNAAATTHCHRRPPISNGRREWHFPQVGPAGSCSEWVAKVDEPRDGNGAPERLLCALCRHSSAGAHACRLRAPAHITHEGDAVYPEISPTRWCGEAEVEAGIENEVFIGAPPAVVYDLRDRRKAG